MKNITENTFDHKSRISALRGAGFSNRAIRRLEADYFANTDTVFVSVCLLNDGKIAIEHTINGKETVDFYSGKSLRQSRLLPFDCRRIASFFNDINTK